MQNIDDNRSCSINSVDYSLPSQKPPNRQCNPNPIFSLPNQNCPPQAIIPGYLLNQAQKIREDKNALKASEQAKTSQQISDDIRQGRQNKYFPDKKPKN